MSARFAIAAIVNATCPRLACDSYLNPPPPHPLLFFFFFLPRVLHELLRGPRTPTVSRSPMFGPAPRSPASATGTWTPIASAMSPRSPLDRTYPSPVTPASATPKGGLFSASVSRPAEEKAVREALGLSGYRGDVQGARLASTCLGGSGSGVNRAAGGAPLCLLLKNLGEVFRWDAAAAADICADAFPGVRPW